MILSFTSVGYLRLVMVFGDIISMLDSSLELSTTCGDPPTDPIESMSLFFVRMIGDIACLREPPVSSLSIAFDK